MARRKLSRKANKRVFNKGLKTKAINSANPMRGGIRL